MEAFVEEAKTYEECIEKISKKFGPHAKITKVKNEKKQYLLGLIEKDIVRVNFYIPNNIPIKEEEYEAPKSRDISKFTPPNEADARLSIMEMGASKSDNIKAHVTPIIEKVRQERTYPNKTSEEETLNTSEEDIKKLAQTVEKLAEQITQKTGSSEEHENIIKIAEILEDNDFTPKYIRSIKDKIKNNFSLIQLDDFDLLQEQVIKWIAEAIKIKTENYELTETGKVISLVGPTGIGKTTSIAKLAAYYVIEVSRKVGKLLDVKVITTDGYRMAAADQMKTYCKHMKIPMEVAYTASDLHKFLELYKNKADVICVDTTGRSPSDYAKILEMQRDFEVIDKTYAETYLAISAGSKAMDMKEIMKNYSGFEYSGLIITKLDETVTVGSLISVLAESDTPISFITTGCTKNC